MNGIDLVLEARRLRRGLATLLTSGGTEMAAGPHRALPAGTLRLSMPYRRQALAWR